MTIPLRRLSHLLLPTALAALLAACATPAPTTTALDQSAAPARATANGAVVLEWTPPSGRVDGAPLARQDLAGYRIYVGAEPNQPSRTIDIPDAKQTRYVVRGLKPGQTYYFSVTALDTRGRESPRSGELAERAEPLSELQTAKPDLPVEGDTE